MATEDMEDDAKPNQGVKDIANSINPKKTRSFYFVKFCAYEDPILEVKNKMREAIKMLQVEHNEVVSEIRSLTLQEEIFKDALDARWKVLSARSARRDTCLGLCSSEQELDVLIRNLSHRVRCERNTLVEEKRLFTEIKAIEKTRETVVANDEDKATAKYDQWQKIRSKIYVVKVEIRRLEAKLKTIDRTTKHLEKVLAALINRQSETYGRAEWNKYYSENLLVLRNARELVNKNDIATLEKLSHSEVEKFMSKWNSDKTFRDDYERSMMQSINNRELSKDGRIRKSNEEPLPSVAQMFVYVQFVKWKASKKCWLITLAEVEKWQETRAAGWKSRRESGRRWKGAGRRNTVPKAK